MCVLLLLILLSVYDVDFKAYVSGTKYKSLPKFEIYVYTYIYIYVYMYTYIHICIHIYIYIYIYMCIHIYIYMYTHIFTHMYIYIYQISHKTFRGKSNSYATGPRPPARRPRASRGILILQYVHIYIYIYIQIM